MSDPTRFQPIFGAQVIGEEQTRFALWAPDAQRVDVEVEDLPSATMVKADDGCLTAEIACGHGARYRYRIFGDDDDEGSLIPDPAARAQAGDIDGPSVVIDPNHYQWRNQSWQGRPWHETVLYELHAGTLGGFEGVRRRLPYLAELGITAIELMPVSEFPGARNWGYDGVLPYAVEASYGSPDELKALVDEAHGLGLMVFLDVVYNHFGPDGNYLASYASTFFREDLTTPWGPAIDFRQPQVRRYFIDNALMWLEEYRLDGLRFDAVHAISEQDFLVELAETVRTRITPERHVHLVLENEGNTASLLNAEQFNAQWNDDWHNVIHVLLTDETEGYYSDFVDDATARLARCLSEGFIYQGAQTRHGHTRGEPSAHLPPTAFVAFLQNHDQTGNRALGERLNSLANPDALAAATALLLLSPMVPLLFMGEEWGATQPFLFFTEHNEELAQAVREGRRAEFADFSAFLDEKARERIPDPNALSTFEASIPDFDARGTAPHDACLERYRTLLALRHQHIVPRLQGARSLGAEQIGDKAILARWQMSDETHLVIVLNLGEHPAATRGLGVGQLLYETDVGVAKAAQSGRIPPRAATAWLLHNPGDEEVSA
ncbi:malto-oligosyltrehalose trehalohydrolase [Vreelandella populi]|uniref:Malto-oligosyltrehalose trehalohydrolase n=1 Tax=Vreelandella populi TaxID=2498858 RepID=A0A433LFT9_9GAMM|nr:malto-oligosyltrehalose trehalohydrolase [Halomonas populi]RUR37778.1 malto-oligosyltrehalose trehalohydrolase [Halomonas populi]RUR48687.1 malto-oligosyltrehalose trehalohydrolase [Halomonas populi]